MLTGYWKRISVQLILMSLHCPLIPLTGTLVEQFVSKPDQSINSTIICSTADHFEITNKPVLEEISAGRFVCTFPLHLFYSALQHTTKKSNTKDSDYRSGC